MGPINWCVKSHHFHFHFNPDSGLKLGPDFITNRDRNHFQRLSPHGVTKLKHVLGQPWFCLYCIPDMCYDADPSQKRGTVRSHLNLYVVWRACFYGVPYAYAAFLSWRKFLVEPIRLLLLLSVAQQCHLKIHWRTQPTLFFISTQFRFQG